MDPTSFTVATIATGGRRFRPSLGDYTPYGNDDLPELSNVSMRTVIMKSKICGKVIQNEYYIRFEDDSVDRIVANEIEGIHFPDDLE